MNQAGRLFGDPRADTIDVPHPNEVGELAPMIVTAAEVLGAVRPGRFPR